MKKFLKEVGKLMVALIVTLLGVVVILTILTDELKPLPPEEYEEEEMYVDDLD